jgi:hypothetical protein
MTNSQLTKRAERRLVVPEIERDERLHLNIFNLTARDVLYAVHLPLASVPSLCSAPDDDPRS